MSKETLKALVEEIFTSNSISGLTEILKKDFIKGTNGWESIVNTVNDVFVVIGVLMVLIFFTMDLAEHLKIQQVSLEYLFKAILKLAVGVILVSNCIVIFGNINYACINLNKQVIDSLHINEETTSVNVKDDKGEDKKVETTVQTSTMIAKIEKAGRLENFGNYIWLFIMMLAQLVIGLLIKWVAYSRMLKMYLLATFAPIAVADTVNGGMNSKGVRYIKNFIALGLQGIIISVIIYARNAVVSWVDTSNFVADFTLTFVGSYLISQLIVAMAIQRSEQIAKEIMGV